MPLASSRRVLLAALLLSLALAAPTPARAHGLASGGWDKLLLFLHHSTAAISALIPEYSLRIASSGIDHALLWEIPVEFGGPSHYGVKLRIHTVMAGVRYSPATNEVEGRAAYRIRVFGLRSMDYDWLRLSLGVGGYASAERAGPRVEVRLRTSFAVPIAQEITWGGGLFVAGAYAPDLRQKVQAGELTCGLELPF